MEEFNLTEVATNLSIAKILILIAVAFFASVISGISGYGGGMTLGLLVSPFIPIKLLVPLMSIFVFFSNLSRMYFYRDHIFLEKRNVFCITRFTICHFGD